MYYTITRANLTEAYNIALKATADIPTRYNRKIIKSFNAEYRKAIELFREARSYDLPAGTYDWVRLANCDLGHGRNFDTYYAVVEMAGISRASAKSVWDLNGTRYSRRLMLAIVEG